MYTEEQLPMAVVQVGAGAADVLTAAAVHSSSYVVLEQCKISRFLALVTTEIANDSAAAVVTMKQRILYGSSSGEVDLTTITFPDGTAAGKVLYSDFEAVQLNPGDEVVFEVTTAGTDGSSAAGGAIYGALCFHDPETPANQTDMVESA